MFLNVSVGPIDEILYQELLNEQVVQRAARTSLTEACRDRFVSKSFAKYAAKSVKTLSCDIGCNIPKKIWLVFPNADGLRMDLKQTKPKKGAVFKMLGDIPRNRIHRFTHLNSPLGSAENVVSLISGAPAMRKLQHVTIDGAIPTHHADDLIAGLHHLKQANLRILADSPRGKPWAPAAGPSISNLSITGEDYYCDPLQVDISGFARSKNLAALILNGCRVSNIEEFKSLTRLQALSVYQCQLSDDESEDPQKELLTAFSKIPLIKSLVLDWPLSAEYWELLARLQHLAHLSTPALSLTATSTPCTSLTSLSAVRGVDFAEDKVALGDILPALKQLNACTDGFEPYVLPSDFSGHSNLLSLSLTEGRCRGTWEDGTLSAITNLKAFSFAGGGRTNLNAVLRDAAQCQELHTLKLGHSKACSQEITHCWSAIFALLDGPCSKTIHTLELESYVGPLQPDAALRVLSQLSKLRHAVLTVRWDSGLAQEHTMFLSLLHRLRNGQRLLTADKKEAVQQLAELRGVYCAAVRKQVEVKLREAGLVVVEVEPRSRGDVVSSLDLGDQGVKSVTLVMVVGAVRVRFVLVERLGA
jgi:hypothetical protein